MQNNTIKCEKCGGSMDKIDNDRMKCGACGTIVNTNMAKKDTKENTTK